MISLKMKMKGLHTHIHDSANNWFGNTIAVSFTESITRQLNDCGLSAAGKQDVVEFDVSISYPQAMAVVQRKQQLLINQSGLILLNNTRCSTSGSSTL